MTTPTFNPEPDAQPRDGAVRLWLSQQQWMSVLEDTQRRACDTQTDIKSTRVNRRETPRLPTPSDMRCLIRLGNNTSHHGTYLVKLRDISAAGLGFNATQSFSPYTRCTVALQAPEGHGLVCAASVMWCKPIDEELHNVGIRFDRPITPNHFITGSENNAQ